MEELPRWMAYGHPVLMFLSVGIAGTALRFGLKMRRARQRQGNRVATDRPRHLLYGKIAVGLISFGIVGGAVSMGLIRGEETFQSFHSWVASAVVVLFIATAIIGHKLEAGDRSVVEAHALFGVLACLAAAVATVAGFILLP